MTWECAGRLAWTGDLEEATYTLCEGRRCLAILPCTCPVAVAPQARCLPVQLAWIFGWDSWNSKRPTVQASSPRTRPDCSSPGPPESGKRSKFPSAPRVSPGRGLLPHHQDQDFRGCTHRTLKSDDHCLVARSSSFAHGNILLPAPPTQDPVVVGAAWTSLAVPTRGPRAPKLLPCAYVGEGSRNRKAASRTTRVKKREKVCSSLTNRYMLER